MSLLEILSTGAVVAVLVQIIQFIKDLFFLKKRAMADARAQAFKLSNKLMSFAMKCEISLNRAGIEEVGPGMFEPVPAEIPREDFLALTEGLTAISPELLARIADIEFQMEFEEDYIRAGYQLWMDIDDVALLQKKRADFLISEARKLASSIRAEYRLPAFGEPNHLLAPELAK